MAFHIDYSVCIVLMAILTAIYVIAGGYMATAINDFIQGIIMLAGIIAIIVAVLHSKGGFMAALDGLGHVVILRSLPLQESSVLSLVLTQSASFLLLF